MERKIYILLLIPFNVCRGGGYIKGYLHYNFYVTIRHVNIMYAYAVG